MGLSMNLGESPTQNPCTLFVSCLAETLVLDRNTPRIHIPEDTFTLVYSFLIYANSPRLFRSLPDTALISLTRHRILKIRPFLFIVRFLGLVLHTKNESEF